MGERTRERWQVWVSALLLLMIAAGLARQWPVRGLWYDETVNAYFAERSLTDIWEWCTQIDNQMPLDYALRKLWADVAGTSEFALRAYSWGLALLSVAGMIALGRRLTGQPFAGWMAGTAYATTQSLLYAAFEVRPYALALALLAWSSVLLWSLWMRYAVCVDSLPRLDRRYGVLLMAYLLLALAMLYTHYTGLLALLAHGVFVGMAALRCRTRRQITLAVHLAVGLVLGYVPWLLALAGRDVRAGTAYADRILPRYVLETYAEFFAYGQHFPAGSPPPYALMLVLLVLICGGLWIGLAAQRRKARWYGFTFALSVLFVPLVGLLVMVYGVQSKLSGRHGWPLWIGAALVIGLGVNALPRARNLHWLAATSVVVLIWLPGRAALQPTYNSYLREAFAYVDAHAEPGDVLVLRDGTLFTAAEYYATDVPWIGLPPDKITDVKRFLFLDEAIDALDAFIMAHDAQRVWVVSWQGHIMDPQDLVGGVLELIGEPLPLGGAYGFGDVSLSLYRLHDTPRHAGAGVMSMQPVVQMPQGGPVFYGGYVLNKGPVPYYGAVVIHTWWQRGPEVQPDMRVSMRLYDTAGNFYTQFDQPPVGPSFGQENWLPGSLIFSRFVLWVPPEMPLGVAEVKLVIYHMNNAFEPFVVPVDTFIVQ